MAGGPAAHAGSVETGYGWIVVVASHLLVATAIGSSYLIIVSLKPIAAEFAWPRSIPSLAYSLPCRGHDAPACSSPRACAF